MLFATLLLTLAPAQDASELITRFSVDPTSVAIGQPIQCSLEVEHAPNERVQLPLDSLSIDDTWVVLSDPRIERDQTQRLVTTRFTWEIFSLDAGEREVPAPVAYRADGAALNTQGTRITVQSDLLPQEDAPRPFASFHDVEGTGRVQSWHWLVLLVAFGGLGFWRFTRRPRTQAEEVQPSPTQQLAVLQVEADAASARNRDLIFEIARLARSAVDERQSTDRSGLTDEEWLAQQKADGALPAEVLNGLETLLAGSERVKYAGEAPTRFAVEESLKSARELIGRSPNTEESA